MNFVGWIEPVPGDLGHGAAKRLKVVDQRLVDQNVAVCEKKRPFDRACLPQPPDDLKCRVSLPSPCGHNQQDPTLTGRDSFYRAVDCISLIVARSFAGRVFVKGLED